MIIGYYGNDELMLICQALLVLTFYNSPPTQTLSSDTDTHLQTHKHINKGPSHFLVAQRTDLRKSRKSGRDNLGRSSSFSIQIRES